MSAFVYPFDGDMILKKKRSIKKQLLCQKGLLEVRIAILSGSTIGDIQDILELFLLDFGIKPLFYCGQYNRFYEDVLFENKELSDFRPDIIYIHTSAYNLSDDDLLNKLKSMWERIKADFGCTIIQNNFELPSYRFLDNCGKINELNLEISRYAEKNNSFYINDIQYLSAFYGLEKWIDEQSYYLYKYAFNIRAIPLVCHNIAKIIKSIYGKNRKCLVLDLDNTLWGGVVGDVGALGIELGAESALGEAYVSFQRYVKKLHDIGIILAVCSKNDEQIAKEAFKNPNMILQLEDIAVFCANWNSKAENILAIANQLNILPESLVFIDDSPFERELVKRALPEVAVLEVDSVVDFVRYIDWSGCFDTTHISSDDIKRNEYYNADSQRNETKASFENYGDYLESLQMSSKISPFCAEHLDRITQLINKTNQFNLTTKRYTFNEIEKIAADERYITLYATLDDKFGNNGIVSALIGEIVESELHIRLWVMSCRVFRRDLELAIFDRLIEICQKKKMTKLVGYYFKTEKNAFVSRLLETLAFHKVTNEVWEFYISDKPVCNNHYIKIVGRDD